MKEAKGYCYSWVTNPKTPLKLQIVKIPSSSSQSQSHVNVEQQDNVLNQDTIKGWSKKRKRGCKTLSENQQQQGNKTGVYQGIRQVILKKKNQKRFAEEQLVGINRLTFKKQKRIDHQSSVPNKFSTQQLIRFMLRIGFNDKQVVDMILSRQARLSRNKLIAQGGIVTATAAAYDFNQNNSHRFKCAISNKSFSTYQAFRAHISAAPCNNIEDPSKFSALGNAAAVRKENQCVDLVANSIPTSWALRGHRTLHRPSPSVLQPPTIASTYSLETSDLSHSAGSRKKLDFDLNELPTLEQGEAVPVPDFAYMACDITSIVQPIQAAS